MNYINNELVNFVTELYIIKSVLPNVHKRKTLDTIFPFIIFGVMYIDFLLTILIYLVLTRKKPGLTLNQIL